jgi:hypothetical protein
MQFTFDSICPNSPQYLIYCSFFGPEVLWRSSLPKVLNPSFSAKAAMSSGFYLVLKLIAGFLIMIVPIPLLIMDGPSPEYILSELSLLPWSEASTLRPKSEVTMLDLNQPRALVPRAESSAHLLQIVRP